MTRKEAREYMMKVFFQIEAATDFDLNAEDNYIKEKSCLGQKKYCHDLFSSLCNNKGEIDDILSRYSKWNINRMIKTDLAILRLACCELLYMKDIPSQVIINEAVEMSKIYGKEDSYKYVNGILSKILNDFKEQTE